MNRVNDFAFKIATANGTGSASANGLIMQAIFRMGVPVTGKNVFPSNIQGLPTWYEIRVNKNGYTARTPRVRSDGGAERRHLREGRGRGAVGRLAAVRLVLAARREAAAPRRHLPGRAAGRDVQRRLQGRARAHPDEEHRLCRRAGGAARDRHRDHPRAAEGEVRPQAGADGLEPEGASALGYDYAKANFAVPAADSARAARTRPRTAILIDGNTAAGARLRVRGRDRRRLVSRSRRPPR